MVANDEARARQLLLDMQGRLARDPYEALGLVGSPTPADIRTAFLSLTKRFHPARFGRMATEIQKLANEVFLALRAAHDTLVRPEGRAARAQRAPGLPPGTGPAVMGRVATRPLPTYATRTPASPHAPRAVTPPPAANRPRGFGVSVTPVTNAGVGNGAPRAPAPRTPQPPRRSGLHPATPAQPVDRELAPILALLEQGQFAASKIALETLAGRAPENVRYRALVAYAKGREAQLTRRLDEARVELQEALQIDPSLELARIALGELFTRRK